MIKSTRVEVGYSTFGNLTHVREVHLQLDDGAWVVDSTLDGEYELNKVPAGSHVLNAYLAKSDHSKIPGTEAQITFVIAP